jgi:hypothetical protein
MPRTAEEQDRPLPPHDLEAEAAVLACALESPEHRRKVSPYLRREHFYSMPNGQAWRAMLELDAAGVAVTEVTLRSTLDSYSYPKVDSKEVLSVLLRTPFYSDIEVHADIILNKARLRKLSTVAERISLRIPHVNGEADEFCAEAIKDITEAASAREQSDGVEWITGADVFAPQPPVDWLVKGIYLCSGRPMEIIGKGYTGKTVIAQHLCLSVAAGAPVWGKFACKQGRVVHIDHEVGRRATLKRYARLAFVEQITPDMVADRLRIACLPKVRLSDAQAEDWYMRTCDGVALCMIDSLRAAMPGVDENEAFVRDHIDKLLRVSERTGCSFVLLHHTGKGGEKEDERDAGRGSVAIFDAGGTVLKLTAEKQGQKDVTITKAHMTKATSEASGAALPDFWLRIEDVPDDNLINERAGLRCSHLESWTQGTEDAAEERLVTMYQERILTALQREAKPLSTDQVRACIRAKREATANALLLLEVAGKVKRNVQPPRNGGTTWSIT